MPLSLSCTLLRHERHGNSVRVAMQPQSPASSQGALQALHRLACRTCTARGTHREERVVAGLARGSHLRRRVVARPCGRPHGPWRRPSLASNQPYSSILSPRSAAAPGTLGTAAGSPPAWLLAGWPADSPACKQLMLEPLSYGLASLSPTARLEAHCFLRRSLGSLPHWFAHHALLRLSINALSPGAARLPHRGARPQPTRPTRGPQRWAAARPPQPLQPRRVLRCELGVRPARRRWAPAPALQAAACVAQRRATAWGAAPVAVQSRLPRPHTRAARPPAGRRRCTSPWQPSAASLQCPPCQFQPFRPGTKVLLCSYNRASGRMVCADGARRSCGPGRHILRTRQPIPSSPCMQHILPGAPHKSHTRRWEQEPCVPF